MLHKIIGQSRVWQPHSICVFAIIPALVIQLAFLRVAHNDRTAGACLSAIAILSYLVRSHADIAVVANVGFLFLWGIRICVRGVPSGSASFVRPSSCDAVLSKAVWTWIFSAPTVFAVAFDLHELPKGFPELGATLCLIALMTDVMEQNVNRGRFTRNPYAFCSLSMCWGLFWIHPSPWTFVFPVLFSVMVIYSQGGYRWAEAMRKDNCEEREYVRTTSPLVPLPPGVYGRMSMRAKMYLCFETNVTN
jgi:hypothetical protein